MSDGIITKKENNSNRKNEKKIKFFKYVYLVCDITHYINSLSRKTKILQI